MEPDCGQLGERIEVRTVSAKSLFVGTHAAERTSRVNGLFLAPVRIQNNVMPLLLRQLYAKAERSETG